MCVEPFQKHNIQGLTNGNCDLSNRSSFSLAKMAVMDAEPNDFGKLFGSEKITASA
jgi:hypothetical protein